MIRFMVVVVLLLCFLVVIVEELDRKTEELWNRWDDRRMK